jgi:hypothetical protein
LDLFSLNNRLQILIRDRLDNVPIFVEHLNVTAPVAHALPGILQRVLSACFTAIDRTNAFGFENFPAALFLPSRVA